MERTDNYRMAVMPRAGRDTEALLKRVQAYLPSNYSATYIRANDTIFIVGIDNAGWTLDGYVLPRLASSGDMAAKEIRGDEVG